MKKNKSIIFLLSFFLLLTGCRAEAEVTIPEKRIGNVRKTLSSEPTMSLPKQFFLEEVPVVFSEEITFTGEYIRDGVHMPYALFTPSSAGECDNVPLIVFLHGRGERNTIEAWFMHTGMTQVMEEWSLEGFNAYVLCPQLYGQWNPGSWDNQLAATYVMDLLTYFSMEQNVDPNRIIMVGFSAGALGAMHLAHEYPDYFSKLVVMSSPATNCPEIYNITIPTVGYSETAVSFNSFMKEKFLSIFGEDSVHYFDVRHIYVPDAAFNEDLDGNNRSDLVEWMLSLS